MPHFIMEVATYLSMLGLKLIHVSKEGPEQKYQPTGDII